ANRDRGRRDRPLMRAHTEYLWFNTRQRRELVNITDRVAAIVAASKITDGFCLVSAMHITAGIWVNDEESGLKQDLVEWLDRLARAPGQPHRVAHRPRVVREQPLDGVDAAELPEHAHEVRLPAGEEPHGDAEDVVERAPAEVLAVQDVLGADELAVEAVERK